MRAVRMYREVWPLRTPLFTARGSRSEAEVVVVEMEEDGWRGVGECAPWRRFGESVPSVMAQIASILPQLERSMTREQLQQALPPGAARNAVDCAFWDLAARRAGQSLTEYLGVTLKSEVTSACTLQPDEPTHMAAAARGRYNQGARLFRVRLDDRLISERLVAIREAVPDASLMVDASESWHSDGLAARCQLLADLGVVLLEQPLSARDDAALENFIHPLPICADESCHTRSSLKALAGRYEFINIKLDKCGGLTEGLALSAAAREQGFEVVLGGASCTSRAVSSALPLATQARYVDLEGPDWLAVDVEPGLRYEGGRILLDQRGPSRKS